MGYGTISGGTYTSTVSNSGTISGGTFKGTVNNCDDRGQLVGRISGGNFQNATVNGKYTVHVTAGKNMQVTSGSTTQSDLLVQEMTPVVVTADNGYYFPTDYTVAEKDGVKVTRDSASQVTVSGMPCYNVNITLPDAARVLTPDQARNRAFGMAIDVDVSDEKRMGAAAELFFAAPQTLLIDHHATNTRFAQMNVVDGQAAATAELIVMLYDTLNVPLDADAAFQLYCALQSDSGNF